MQDLDRRGLATLASGHAAADLCQGSIPALIPFLVHQRGYSFGAAGVLLLVVTIGSSIIQPVFGALSDRLQLAWLMPVGVALAAVGIAGSGLFDSFALTCIVVGLGGLGVAAFHPEGARYANYASGDRRGTGMSLFSVGGNAGFALAPVLITPAVLLVGLSGTLIVAILPAIVAVVLAVELPKMKRRSAAAAQASPTAQSDRSDDQWGAFSTPRRRRLDPLRRLLRAPVVRGAVAHPHLRGERGERQRGAGRDAVRGRARDARRRAARGPDRPPHAC